MNESYDVQRSVSEVSFSGMADRLLSSSSQSFPVKKEIPASVLKQLVDKNYEKRKLAGFELHKCLSAFAEKGNVLMIRNAIEMFRTEYIESSIEILKKAGLMAFSAIATTVIMNEEFFHLTTMLVFPVIACFRDSDSKIRFAAVEAMYNIGKICRVKILEYFHGIFRPMTDLFADNDLNVKKAVEKLDSLLKTLMVEAEASAKLFDSGKFMVIFREMLISSTNPNVQKLLVSWIMVLDSIPNFSILPFLSNYLEGVFLLLGSKHDSVKKTAYNFLKDLLSEILSSIYIDIDLLFVMETLAKFAKNPNEVVRSEAIIWTSELLDRSDKVLFKIFPSILKATLHCLADNSALISEKAKKVNSKLTRFFNVTSKETSLSLYEETVDVFMQFINHESKSTRQAILEWIIALQAIRPESFESKLGMLLETLSSRIADPEETIIESILQVLCKVAEYKGYFDKVMENILKLFSQNFFFLDEKAGMVVTFLCRNLGTETVYKSFAKILISNKTLKFAERIVQVLHELILTDPSLNELRERLNHCLVKQDMECIQFFEILYKAWCISPISTLSLSFLVQAYELAYEILQILSRCTISSELLTQLARFVQFLNSPCFVYLRLQLLDHYKYPFLLISLYAILMILPNSRAYSALQVRLKDVASLHKNLEIKEEEENSKIYLIKFDELKGCFISANWPQYRRFRMSLRNSGKVSQRVKE